MSLIALIVLLVVVGFIVWLVLQVPMPQAFQNIIIGIVVLFLVLYLLQSFGLIGSVGSLRLK